MGIELVIVYAIVAAVMLWSAAEMVTLVYNQRVAGDFIDAWYDDEGAPWNWYDASSLDTATIPDWPRLVTVRNVIRDPKRFVMVIEHHGIGNVTPALRRAYRVAKKMEAGR